MAFSGAIVIFIIVYALIIWEKVHRMIVAMIGGLAMLLLGFIDQSTAVTQDIDFNTIGLLIGMMIIVAITRRSGVFEALAIWAARAARGNPLALLALLSLITAAASALLDNVTTVLLIVPVTFTLADKLTVPATPFLLAEIVASNIGGTATLIGDPPNIMIGSATGLDFAAFITNLAPVVAGIMATVTVILVLLYRHDLTADAEKRQHLLSRRASEAIKDWRLLKQSLTVLALTMLGFILHGALHLESATIALSGAMLLLAISREEPEDVLLHVEWPTLFFFVGLFVLVGGLKAAGVINALARWSIAITGGETQATVFITLWLSAIASAFIDNIPFVATMIPLLQEMQTITGTNAPAIWWALALGACLGGNGTLIGASANVIVAGLAEKQGCPISFRRFFILGFPLMLLSVILAHIFIWWRYF